MAGGTRVQIAGRDVIAFDVLSSTNDEAAQLGRAGAPEGTVVWALRQTQGRGRRGRDWVSVEGNLFVSVLFRPQVAPARAAELSFVTAVATAAAVDALNRHTAPGSPAAVCKWPNDILLDGGKVAGILLESETDSQGAAWVVGGIGVNLSSHPLNVERRAASLPHAIKPEAALEALLPALDHYYALWRDGGFSPIRTAWLEKAVGVGGGVAVRLAQETVEGVFHGLDSDGVLLLDVGQGLPLRRITAGDVFFAGEA